MPNIPTAPAVGAVTIAIAGVTAVLTPDSMREWLAVFTDFLPLALCVALFYWIWKVDKSLADCMERDRRCTTRMLTLYKALRGTGTLNRAVDIEEIEEFEEELENAKRRKSTR